ncbi:MAG: hypothetical protein ACREIP_20170 [Alphaproteobacteria bacterium]
MKGAALSERISGKSLVVERTGSGSGEGRLLRFSFHFRSDGSVEIRCESRPMQASSGSWRGCRQFNPGNTAAPERDLGTWRIEADQLIMQRLRTAAEGREEGRFTFHAQGEVVAARRLTGSAFCVPGIVRLE